MEKKDRIDKWSKVCQRVWVGSPHLSRNVGPPLYSLVEKSQYIKWRKKEKIDSVKTKTRLPANKVHLSIFFVHPSSFLIAFLNGKATINAAYYCERVEKLRLRIDSKEEINQFKISFSHRSPHCSSQLNEMHWTDLIILLTTRKYRL